MEFRNLKAEEIEVRVGQCSEDGFSLLLYKDARVDMTILDEIVKKENWQRRHYEVKNNMYCSVGIKCGGEWIWKDDCGVESNAEKEKGEASDSFKRACVNWGIGRELYTAPFIYVKGCVTKQAKSGKWVPLAKGLYVSEIEISDNKIIEWLTIRDGKRILIWSNKPKQIEKVPPIQQDTLPWEDKPQFSDQIEKALTRAPINLNGLANVLNKGVAELTDEDVVRALERKYADQWKQYAND